MRLRLSVRHCTITATPPGRVALVGDRLVGDALFLAGAALDRALDRVHRHRVVARLADHRAQRRVRLGIAAALARRDFDLADQHREQLAALGVGRALLVLDRMPLGMTGHQRHLADEELVQAQVARELGMERREADAPWRPKTGTPSCSASTSTPAPTRSTIGRPDEHARERSARRGRVTVEVGLERLALAAVPVAAHGHVEHAERLLVGRGRRRPRARARSGPRTSRTRAGRRASCSRNGSRRPDESSSLSIVVDSPPGRTIASTPARCSGRLTSVTSAPSARERLRVLAERALQREHIPTFGSSLARPPRPLACTRVTSPARRA